MTYYALKKNTLKNTGYFIKMMRFSFDFIGETGIDSGGLRRLMLTLIAKQMRDFKYFIPSAN